MDRFLGVIKRVTAAIALVAKLMQDEQVAAVLDRA